MKLQRCYLTIEAIIELRALFHLAQVKKYEFRGVGGAEDVLTDVQAVELGAGFYRVYMILYW